MPSTETPVHEETGTVRWYDRSRGHGFVTPDRGGPDCFLHQSTICASDQCLIEDGMRIAFEVVQGLVGPFTENVRRL